ncbi:phosphatidylethanolamine-binding protein 1-like [Branchiostoma lanceolatum]|uniref:phosphatidylethanolamine-binding protein 1-like n=1 Tax=Branchiostoma lanceolatum TaxID=7740 RepID=UPI00345585D7
MLSSITTITALIALSNAHPWVPSGDLPMDLTVTFSAPEMVYSVCDRDFTQSAKNFSVATAGVAVNPGQTANDPTMTITGASPGDMFTILMLDSDAPAPDNDVGGTLKPLLHMLITNITNADPSTGTVVDPYLGPMPPPCQPANTYHYLLLKQTAALSLTFDDLPQYTPNCTLPVFAGKCLFEVTNFISSNQLTTVGYASMVAGADGFVRYTQVNDPVLSWMTEADTCKGIDGYDPCPTLATAPPSSSSDNVKMSIMASAWCLIFSFIFALN